MNNEKAILLILVMCIISIGVAWNQAASFSDHADKPIQVTLIVEQTADSPAIETQSDPNHPASTKPEPQNTPKSEEIIESIAVSGIDKEILILAQKKTGVELQEGELQAIYIVGEKTGIHWQTLVALYRVESTCGRDKNMFRYDPYKVLAKEPTQLEALERICAGLNKDPKTVRTARFGEISAFQIRPKTFEAYATDGDNDGIADPWNLQDAAATAAKYLEDLDYIDYTPWSAMAKYNAGKYYRGKKGQGYSGKVLRLAADLGAPLNL